MENIKNNKEATIDLNVAIGVDELGNDLVINIPYLTHLLVGGIARSGKSNLLHKIISTLSSRVSPEDLKLILIDSKKIELNAYNPLPHLLTPVITETKKAVLVMKWAGKEMDRRLEILQSNNVRDIQSYYKTILTPAVEKNKENKQGIETDTYSYLEKNSLPETMPYIVIVVDGLSDAMTTYPKEVEAAITRLTQMSHLVGIHLILSTSRISNKIVPEAIKASVPSRIAFKVSSIRDSMIILGTKGAERLSTKGEILFQSGSMKYPICAQTFLIADKEIKDNVKIVKDKYKESLSSISLSNPQSADDAFDTDDMYEEAREAVIEAGKASTSYVQRKLGVGYSRAAKLMDMLEERGVIGPSRGELSREVLIEDNKSAAAK